MTDTITSTQIVAGGSGGEPAAFNPIMLVLFAILVLFMIMTFRRGKKMRNEQASARSGAVIGAEVVTAGGMVGTVVDRDEERQRITLQFSTGDRVDFLLAAVQQVNEPAAVTDPREDVPTAEPQPGDAAAPYGTPDEGREDPPAEDPTAGREK